MHRHQEGSVNLISMANLGHAVGEEAENLKSKIWENKGGSNQLTNDNLLLASRSVGVALELQQLSYDSTYSI